MSGGGWTVAVRHRTAYSYAGEVHSSYNEARVTPLTTHAQEVLDAATAVEPAATVLRYWDYWGTLVDAFDVHQPHRALAVTATSVVHTAAAEPPGPAGWDEVRAAVSAGGFAELLSPTSCVPEVPELVDEAGALASRSATPAVACEAAVAWVRDHLRYQAGATDVTTTAAQALALGAGVCQDFSHVTAGLLRAMGIPARYVSGYAFPSSGAEVGQDVAGEGHAWVEAWTGTWWALDPTHGAAVGAGHVVVGRGRDYADVPPLKGIYRGAPADGLRVSVELARRA